LAMPVERAIADPRERSERATLVPEGREP